MDRVTVFEYPTGHLIGCECDGCYRAGSSLTRLYRAAERDPDVIALDEEYLARREALVERLLPKYRAD